LTDSSDAGPGASDGEPVLDGCGTVGLGRRRGGGTAPAGADLGGAGADAGLDRAGEGDAAADDDGAAITPGAGGAVGQVAVVTAAPVTSVPAATAAATG
jgi:hypothetical protein